ncbi:MAG: response regulator transcription factor, partial [Clostridiales bacterium]|nr:response regulator transcription factor [Clostridiales bacterium]
MNIIIVDDDNIVALSLKTILESSPHINVLEIGSSGLQAIELYRKHKPDVVLMDIRMDGMTGLEAGEIILKEDKDAKILYLTTFSDDEYIIKSLNIGAKGYILKQDFEGIAPALETVMNGQRVFGDTIISKVPTLMQTQSDFDFKKHGLNEKEHDLIKLVAKGLSNKEISNNLFLSEGTIRNYLSNILDKLDLRDRTQL